MERDAYWGGIADWIVGVAERAMARPVLVGLSAPQGAGKTTLTREVCRMLGARGLRAVAVSIDDFYLTRAEQVALSAAHPRNPYLVPRGLAGTHDVRLGTRTLAALKAGQGPVAVPAYDKGAFGGKGDRLPVERWPVVAPPLDVVIVEGWMLGFQPVPEEALPDPRLGPVNDRLADYAAWHTLLDAFIWLEPEDYNFVRAWRADAEVKAIAEGRPGMTPEQVAEFVKPYLACYPLYFPGLRAGSPVDGPYLHLRLGFDRLPVAGSGF